MSLYAQIRASEWELGRCQESLSKLKAEIEDNPPFDLVEWGTFHQKIETLNESIQEYQTRIAENTVAMGLLSPQRVIKNLKGDFRLFIGQVAEHSNNEPLKRHYIEEAYRAQEIIFTNQSMILGRNCASASSNQKSPLDVLKERTEQIRLNDQEIAERFPKAGQKRKAELSLDEELTRKVRFNVKVKEQPFNIRTRAPQNEPRLVSLNVQEHPQQKYDGRFYAKPPIHQAKFRIRCYTAERKWPKGQAWDELHLLRSSEILPIWRDEKWGRAMDHEYIVFDPEQGNHIPPHTISSLDEAASKGYVVSRVLEFDGELYAAAVMDGPMPNSITNAKEAQDAGYQINKLT